MTTTILFLLIVILLSALFSGMEIAFIASNKLLMEIDLNGRGATSYVINRFYNNSNNFLSTLLVGNNIVLVIYSIKANGGFFIQVIFISSFDVRKRQVV